MKQFPQMQVAAQGISMASEAEPVQEETRSQDNLMEGEEGLAGGETQAASPALSVGRDDSTNDSRMTIDYDIYNIII